MSAHAGFVVPSTGEAHEYDSTDPGSLEAWFTRFWSYAVADERGCWNWTRAVDGKGYGVMRLPRQRKLIRAHRAAFESHNGPIPSTWSVCHRCNNKRCVNPSHLYLATHQQNIRDASADGLMARFCTKGHPNTPENTVGKVRKRCRICTRASGARQRAKTTGAA
jgi:hypothetical protein